MISSWRSILVDQKMALENKWLLVLRVGCLGSSLSPPKPFFFPLTPAAQSNPKPDHYPLGLHKHRSDYKKNNNPNSLGWAGHIYRRAAAATTYIFLSCATAGGRETQGHQDGKECVCVGGFPAHMCGRKREKTRRQSRHALQECVCVGKETAGYAWRQYRGVAGMDASCGFYCALMVESI